MLQLITLMNAVVNTDVSVIHPSVLNSVIANVTKDMSDMLLILMLVVQLPSASHVQLVSHHLSILHALLALTHHVQLLHTRNQQPHQAFISPHILFHVLLLNGLLNLIASVLITMELHDTTDNNGR